MRDFYWAVTSTAESLHSGQLKLAKFQSFLLHVINKHKNLPSTMFKACAHGNITKPKVWMSKGTKIHEFLNPCIPLQIFLLDSHFLRGGGG